MRETLGFISLSIVLLGVTLWFSSQKKWREGMWYVWLTSLLFYPRALEMIPTGGFIIDFTVVATSCCFLGYLLAPAPLVKLGFTTSDLAVLLVPITFTVARFSADEATPMLIPNQMYTWLAPYLVGRFFMKSPDDVPKVARIVAKLCVLNAVFGMVEAVTKINIASKLFGTFFFTEGARFGLARAHNFFSHPISMGQVMILMLPWCIEAAWKPSGKAKVFSLYPMMNLAAIFFTLSRAALINFFQLLYLSYFMKAKNRLVPGLIALSMALVIVFGQDAFISVLATVAGEDESGSSRIMIDGEMHTYNSARHRSLQYLVYNRALEGAGLYGYGLSLRSIMLRYNVHHLFSRSIDNHYILYTLFNGYLGLFAFHFFTVTMVYRFAKVAWVREGPMVNIAGGLFAASAVTAIAFLAVYFNEDSKSVYIFYGGLACNVQAIARRQAKLQAQGLA